MIILSNIIQLCNFSLSLLRCFKFYSEIFDSLACQKICANYAKEMTKDKKVNIAVTKDKEQKYLYTGMVT